jgi:hypothetical protein
MGDDAAYTTFMRELEDFHATEGTESVPIELPTFLGEIPDLHAIFLKVQELGGYDRVINNLDGASWSGVCDALGGAAVQYLQLTRESNAPCFFSRIISQIWMMNLGLKPFAAFHENQLAPL